MTEQFEYDDTARKAAIRQVWVPAWMEKNRPRLLRACGVASIEDESLEAVESARAFVRMMESVIERNYNGEYSTQNLEFAFSTLIKRGLLSTSEPPPAPPKPGRSFTLELRSPGADTRRVKGTFSEADVRGWAARYAKEQQSVRILDSQGRAVDYDTLEPLIDNPLLTRTSQPSQPSQVEANTAEFIRFYNTNSLQKSKSRALHDPEFRNWLEGMRHASVGHASSGGVNLAGEPVEPKRL